MKKATALASALLLAVCMTLAGCGGGDDSGDSGNGTSGGDTADPAVTAGKELYQARCATCHGKTGKGDGPGATNLDPKPRDHTDAEWHASTTDEEMAEIIKKGGAAVGKSATMPPQADLSDEQVSNIVKYIRSLKAE